MKKKTDPHFSKFFNLESIIIMQNTEDHHYLIQEIEDLSHKVIHKLPIPWKNTKLMEIYTYIYKQCIEDYSKNKQTSLALYRLYEKSVEEFARKLLDRLYLLIPPQEVEECLAYCELFTFFCSNLNFAFRYLNKFFVLKFKIMSLEERCRNIFLRSLWPWIEERCTARLQCYNGTLQERNDCARLFRYMSAEKLSLVKCLDAFIQGYRCYFLDALPFRSKLTLEDLMSLYQQQVLHIRDVSEQLALPVLLKDLFSVMVDCFHVPSVDSLVREHAFSVIMNARYELMIALVLIHKEAFLDSIGTGINRLKPQNQTFPIIKRYHDHFKTLDVRLKKEGHEKLGGEVYDCFSVAVSALFQASPSMYTIFSRLVESDPAGFLFITGILEKKEEFIFHYGKLYYSRLIGATASYPTSFNDQSYAFMPLEEMRKYITQPLLYKLESLVNDYRNSLALTRTFSATVPLQPLRCNLFVFSEKMFMRYPHPSSPVSIDNFPCSLLRDNCQSLLAFYKSQHPMRTFSFHFWESLVFLEAVFPSNMDAVYTFRMSVIQYLVLRLFIQTMLSMTTAFTFSELHKRCSSFLPVEDQLAAVLHSFCRRNPPLLCKTGDPRRLSPCDDRFSLNLEFQSRMREHSWELPRFRNDADGNNTTAISAIVNNNNKNDRIEVAYVLRARLMRLIKKATDHRMSKNDLFEHVKDLTRDPVMIQTQLDYLLEQEYIVKHDQQEQEGKEATIIYVYVP